MLKQVHVEAEKSATTLKNKSLLVATTSSPSLPLLLTIFSSKGQTESTDPECLSNQNFEDMVD